MAIDLRAYLRAEDREGAMLDRIDDVLIRSYGGGSMRTRVERFLAVQPDGWVLAWQGDRLAGVGGCIAYPDAGFGWVGLVATDPAAERGGVGTAVTGWLVERLRSHGCASVLDASGPGAPVYRRMGFVDHGETVAMTTHVPVLPDSRDRAEPAVVDNDLFAYDLARFGADRSALLRYLVEVERCPIFTVVRDGVIAGYAVVQDDALGPVLADDEAALSAVLCAAIEVSSARPIRLRVPPESRWHGVLGSWGFEVSRTLAHQRLGIAGLPGRRARVASQASFGEG